MENPKPNAPVAVFKARGISAGVFANASKKGDVFYKVCLQRTYWDGKNYQTSDTYGRDDVPIAVHLLTQAWQHILTLEADAKEQAADD